MFADLTTGLRADKVHHMSQANYFFDRHFQLSQADKRAAAEQEACAELMRGFFMFDDGSVVFIGKMSTQTMHPLEDCDENEPETVGGWVCDDPMPGVRLVRAEW